MERKYLTIAETKEILENIAKEREINEFQKDVLNYVKTLSKTKPEEAKELVKRLTKLDFVNEKMAVKLVDIMPINSEQVRSIFYREKKDLTEEQINKILEILRGE
ncbi:MAG: RNA polymerase Rpb4 family protein [Thermoplasmata archaeon]|jgi:DNA-directed RNA polymerase subunit F